MIKISKKVLPIGKILEEYNTLRTQKKQIEERISVLSKEIKDYAMSNGSKDDKGSYYCSNDNFLFGATAKKKIIVDEEALKKYLKSRGFKDVIKKEVKEVIDEEILQNLVDCGDISDDDINSFTTVSISYSVMCQVNESVNDEVEQRDLPVAALNKPKRNLKFKR